MVIVLCNAFQTDALDHILYHNDEDVYFSLVTGKIKHINKWDFFHTAVNMIFKNNLYATLSVYLSKCFDLQN